MCDGIKTALPKKINILFCINFNINFPYLLSSMKENIFIYPYTLFTESLTKMFLFMRNISLRIFEMQAFVRKYYYDFFTLCLFFKYKYGKGV